MDIRAYNRKAWDKQVEFGNRWTVPVNQDVIRKAKEGDWQIILTPIKPVPLNWFPEIKGLKVLCLASGGGQQAPVLAAAGANVTLLDNSPRQLAQDSMVAERDGLDMKIIEGDMADLSIFPDASFGLIVHPISNLFTPDVRTVWKEAYRVLSGGGVLLAGFTNPAIFLFDYQLVEQEGILQVKYVLPYSDEQSLSADARQTYLDDHSPMEFSHTLEDQIGGQIDAGFSISGLFEDTHENVVEDPLAKYMPLFICTRAVKS